MPFQEQYPIKSSDFTLEAPGEKAVLFIHGYTGSPVHFREYAEFLNKHGLLCRVMRLPGHGSDARDLARTTYLDWQEAVHQELKELSKKKSKIFVLGYSFGSNLALDAAAHYPGLIAGVIVIAAPIFVRHRRTWNLLIRFFNRYSRAQVKRKPWVRKKKVDEYEAAGTYAHIPLRATLDFFSFIDKFTKPRLKEVKTPCLILQGKRDPTVSAKSARYIFEHIGSRDKKLMLVDAGGHAVVSEPLRRRAYQESLDFIQAH